MPNVASDISDPAEKRPAGAENTAAFAPAEVLAASQARTPRTATSIPSLIKWTGSKRSQARKIAVLLPPCRRYFEPLLGGGAMLYLAARPGSVAGDLYLPLIELWKLVQTDPAALAENYRRQWEALRDEHPGYYYAVRDRFNASPNPMDLCFLMRTCVNGITRFNGLGEFNNSLHLSRPGMQPWRFERIVGKWHETVRGVRFVCQDYAASTAEATREDFVYFDPPYSGNYQRYVADLDLDRFFETLERLNRRGVRWALSFDGRRGEKDLTHDVPAELYRRRLFLASGNSPVGKVLNGPIEKVEEALYLSF